MSRSVNLVILLGHLGKDAETRFTPSGVAKTTFSMATSRSWKDQSSGEWKEETDWHNVVVWRREKLADYLVKGVQVHVQGRIQTRSYEKDGDKKWITEIVADEITLCGGGQGGDRGGRDSDNQMRSQPRSAQRGAPQQQKQDDYPYDHGISDDDIPF